MALAQVDGPSAGGVGLNYDLRVVAALALCVLALPPVVNAIMAKAAQQADTEWLRDQDFDGDPELEDPPPLDFQPPPGAEPPPGERPETPPPREPPPRPQCNLQPTAQSKSIQDGISSPRGVVGPLVLQRDDRGVAAYINGTQVTGRPVFELLRDGASVWTYDQQTLGAPVREDHFEPGARAPEEWTLTYDLGGVIYDAFELTLVTASCEAPTNG